MSDLSKYIGERIRLYRRGKHMTIDELAAALGKNKSTVSKYETGNISVDMETLYRISCILGISMAQLTDFQEQPRTNEAAVSFPNGNALFGGAAFYFYFLYGKELYENIVEPEQLAGSSNVLLYSGIRPGAGKESCSNLYYGSILHFDLLSYLSLRNQFNPVEYLSAYIRRPLGRKAYYPGLLFGIHDGVVRPTACKIICTEKQLKDLETLRAWLIVTKEDIQSIKKSNFLISD